jgi:putative ABC transport system permease protein
MDLYHIKLIYRLFNRQKVFSIINVLGLTIGLTACLLACLFVQDELKFDKHFTNTAHIYQVKGNNFSSDDNISENQPGVFLPTLLEKFPEIETGNLTCERDANIGYRGKHFIATNFIYTSPNFFTFYGWKLVKGNPDQVLSAPFNLVISEKKTKEIFGNVDPVGKVLKFELIHDITITGVFKDIPYQSHIKADFIASIGKIQDH